MANSIRDWEEGKQANVCSQNISPSLYSASRKIMSLITYDVGAAKTKASVSKINAFVNQFCVGLITSLVLLCEVYGVKFNVKHELLLLR